MKQLLNSILEPKHYFRLLLVSLLVFILYHATVYFFITSKILNIPPPYSVGDLSRMAYQQGSIVLRKFEITLPKQHIEGENFHHQPIDILTIGDSFSNGGGGGKNPFYQDYLASKYEYTVLNIRPFYPYTDGYMESIILLLNSGALDIIKPKAILLEFGTRCIISHFDKTFDWDNSLPRNDLMNQISNMKANHVANNIPKDIFFINTSNYKTIINKIKYKKSPCLSNGACILPLKKDLFTVKKGNILEFYRDDVKYISEINQNSIINTNNNLNHIADLLKTKGIQLYVMPIVDKHDLYQPYIQNDPYQKNPLYDYLRPLKKEYIFIDTKAILSKEIERGTKDIYIADDTHWSHLASDLVTNEHSFKLLTTLKKSNAI